jgi:hypothetical protein
LPAAPPFLAAYTPEPIRIDLVDSVSFGKGHARRRDDLVYIIAGIQFGTVFVLATIFWGGSIIENLQAAPKSRPVAEPST